MTRSWTGPLALLLLSLFSGTWADAAAQSAPADVSAPADASPAAPAPVDVSRLPIDIRRIERKLRQTSIREERDGLNLRYIIDVYGLAPASSSSRSRTTCSTAPSPTAGPRIGTCWTS
ncbi:MAG TPA: hypothetical protein VI485_24770 [Vicinamibacterales bacterium]|nr:hypothetical protein [Vicinamibacterales bacterium]